MSAWIDIANAVADRYGVDVDARDRLGWINEDGLSGDAAKLRDGKDGDGQLEIVSIGGGGVGGNAVAKFGDYKMTFDGDVSGADAAAEFAALMDQFQMAGVLAEVLTDGAENKTEAQAGGDDIASIWTALAVGMGAYEAREIINPDTSPALTSGDDVTLVKENSTVVDVDYRVDLQSNGIGGGGAFAVFEEESQATGFIDEAQSTDPATLLGVQGGGDSGTWNDVATDYDATKSKDTFTFRSDCVSEEGEIPLSLREIEEFGWTVKVSGEGIGGNAVAKFETETEALAFEAFVDQLLDLGQADLLF